MGRVFRRQAEGNPVEHNDDGNEEVAIPQSKKGQYVKRLSRDDRTKEQSDRQKANDEKSRAEVRALQTPEARASSSNEAANKHRGPTEGAIIGGLMVKAPPTSTQGHHLATPSLRLRPKQGHTLR